MKISDVPVVEDSDDTLGRVGLADLIAEELNSFDLREGAVTAITGSWGSGKTSLINLVKQRLRPKFTILEFNPWLFMSTEDLIVTFFSEVMNELRREQTDYREIIAAIDPYLRALESLKIEPNTAVIGYGAGVVRKLLPHRVPSVTETKKKLRESLKGSERRFVVFIDDLDRLDAMEVREVLRLTRLVGSFPNVLYVLAYDHDRLSRGIANDPVMGNDYLEKMVLAAWRVPHLDTISKKSHLIRFLEQSNILPSTGLSQEAEQRFNGALDNLFVPVMLNLRRIKRYAVAIRLSAKLHRADFDLVDLLLLEALRLYEPEVFGYIASNPQAFATSVDVEHSLDTSRKSASSKAVNELIKTHPHQHVEWVVRELFPYAWRQFDEKARGYNTSDDLVGRRANHLAVLLRYLERHESRELLSLELYRNIVGGLEPESTIVQRLGSVHQAIFFDVVELLERDPTAIPAQRQSTVAASLLSLATRPREVSRSFFDVGVLGAARTVVYQLIQNRPSEMRNGFIHEIYENTKAFEPRFLFVYDLVHPDENGNFLINVTERKALESQLSTDFSQMNSSELESTRKLFWMAKELKTKMAELGLPMPSFIQSPGTAWNLLNTSETISTSSSTTVPSGELLEFWGGKHELEDFVNYLRQHWDYPSANLRFLDVLERFLSSIATNE